MKRRETYLALSFVAALLLAACVPTAQAAECPDETVPLTIEGCIALTTETTTWATETETTLATWSAGAAGWASGPAPRESVYDYWGLLRVYAADNGGTANTWAFTAVIGPSFDVVTFVVIDGTVFAVGARGWANAYADGYQAQAIGYTSGRLGDVESDSGTALTRLRTETIDHNVAYYSCVALSTEGGCGAPAVGVTPPTTPPLPPPIPGDPGCPPPLADAPDVGDPGDPGVSTDVPTGYVTPTPPEGPDVTTPPFLP